MTLLEFANEMQKKLDDNSHKTGWDQCSDAYLLNRLRQETGELARAVARKDDPKAIIREAADVANFAYFIADNCSQSVEDPA